MRRRPLHKHWILLVAALLAAQSCAPGEAPSAEDPQPSTSPSTSASEALDGISDAGTCADLAARTTDQLQRYVDAFDAAEPGTIDEVTTAQQASLDAVADAFRTRARALGCGSLEDEFAVELDRLQGATPLGESIAATLRSSLLVAGEDPSDPGSREVDVTDAAALRTAVATAGTGSVIHLAAGVYELDQTLVFFRGLELVGPTVGTAILRSSADGAGLLSLAAGAVSIEGLTIEHTGTRPASIVVIASGAVRLERVSVAGARATTDGASGFGVAVQASATPLDLALEDVVLRDNEGGGVLLAGSVEAALRGLEVAGPGTCGVCYAGASGGRLEGAAISAFDVGIRLEGDAAPTIADLDLTDNEVGIGSIGTGAFRITAAAVTGGTTGIEIAGDGSPLLEDITVSDTSDAGILVTGAASPRIEGAALTGATGVAIAIGASAAPQITGPSITTTGDVGIAATGDAGGSVTGASVTGPRLGVQADGAATTAFDGITFGVTGDVAVLLTGTATPTLTNLACTDSETGVVLLLDDAAPTLGELGTCTLADQREA